MSIKYFIVLSYLVVSLVIKLGFCGKLSYFSNLCRILSYLCRIFVVISSPLITRARKLLYTSLSLITLVLKKEKTVK